MFFEFEPKDNEIQMLKIIQTVLCGKPVNVDRRR